MTLQSAFPVYPIETLRDLLFQAADRYSRRTALRTKYDGEYRSMTYRELRGRVEELATFFQGRGFQKEDRVAILSENRTEWALAYLAAVTSGLVAVPIDKELTERDIQHILRFSGARGLVCSAHFAQELEGERGDLPDLQLVVSMEGREGAEVSFAEALKEGKRRLESGDHGYRDRTVAGEDLAAIIFTSGTMGGSKAVMLTHRNIASNVMATSHHVAIDHDDVLLSVLPLHHTYECTAGFLTALYQGATICHAESLRRVADNLREVQASVILGVPLLFESFYRRIEAGIKEKGKRKFRLALGVASLTRRLFRLDLRRRLLAELHRKLGGRLRLLISGGAAINPKVSQGFRELGIALIQGYGMTEASPIISVNRVDHFKHASVGLPLPGLEVRILDGEIVLKGPSVMRGYYKNEQATREVLRDGWLHTGDLGYFDKDGFLYISGRKKSVIVTPNGKNVYPEEIETLLNESPYILESLVWGGPEEDPAKVEVQAIIVPQTETFDHEFGPSGYTETQVHEVIAREVKECNKQLAGFKRIKKFTIRWEEFEKTTTRKIKRYLYIGKPKTVGKGA